MPKKINPELRAGGADSSGASAGLFVADRRCAGVGQSSSVWAGRPCAVGWCRPRLTTVAGRGQLGRDKALKDGAQAAREDVEILRAATTFFAGELDALATADHGVRLRHES
jgi:hypothetical protein